MSNPETDPAPVTPAARRIVIDVIRQPLPDLVIRFENVTPAEVFGAAWLLDQLAREVRTQQIMAQAQGRPVTPAADPRDLANLLRSFQG